MQVLPFSNDNLSISLSNKYTSPKSINQKKHFKFLLAYLGSTGLNTNTIVIEEDYVSKDFLHDYCAYYAQCYEEYPKRCKRVHFFSNSFTHAEFCDVIVDETLNQQEFWDCYLGFIVVKPIPLTVIGYTILKTYSNGDDFNGRNFWGLRNYNVHIYGNEIKLPSLAFQEQDSVLAACATTAIWSMLNKAANDSHTILKSPSQITKDADKVSLDGSRLFPNKGLSIIQICQAIQNSGLVSEIKRDNFVVKDADGNIVYHVSSNQYLKKILNAYSQIGIPIILVIYVPNGGAHGLHAITVSGFNQKAPTLIAPKDSISWLADNIEKVYAHDDQWGPFARITFNGDVGINTPWSEESGIDSYVNNIVVPLYPKIRISYEDIEVIAFGLDSIFKLFFGKATVADLVWDIKLLYSESFKTNLKESSLTTEEKLARISQHMPKYLWVITCYIGENKIFDFSFDATAVTHAMYAKDFICYVTPDIKSKLNEFLKTNRGLLLNLFKHSARSEYYDFLIEESNN